MKGHNVVDARNLACPQPVLQAHKAMLIRQPVTILVSKKDQAGNVVRMAERNGWKTVRRQTGDWYEIDLIPGAETKAAGGEPGAMMCSAELRSEGVCSPTVVIGSESMGRGDDKLGNILMKAFVNTLKECSPKPSRLVLYNSGVKLAVEGSPVLESLNELVSGDVEVLVCGTCLDYFDIRNKLVVGTVSNMYDIAETMLAAGIATIG